MRMVVHRSIDQAIRSGLTWAETWQRDDRGIIFCWERGREMRVERPELASRADNGELVTLPWKGGTEDLPNPKEGKKEPVRYGSLNYLAMWQGLRNEDLNVSLTAETHIKCSKSQRDVTFRASTPSTND